MAKGVYLRTEKHNQQLIRARTFALLPEARKKNSESHKGQIAWNKGIKGIIKQSEELKKKRSRIAKELGIGKWMIGKYIAENHRNWKGGLPKCNQCNKQLSVRYSKTGKCRSCAAQLRTGINNNMWKGGITPLYMKIRGCSKYIAWRKAVFERDDYTCTSCKQRGGQLEADHLIPFYYIIESGKINSFEKSQKSFMLWWVPNGRTRCKPCHRGFPTHLIWKEGLKAKAY